MVKKRPGPKAKTGPKKKRSKKTVQEPVEEPSAVQVIDDPWNMDNPANIPDFICVTDTESEEEPEVKPIQVRGFMDYDSWSMMHSL